MTRTFHSSKTKITSHPETANTQAHPISHHLPSPRPSPTTHHIPSPPPLRNLPHFVTPPTRIPPIDDKFAAKLESRLWQLKHELETKGEIVRTSSLAAWLDSPTPEDLFLSDPNYGFEWVDAWVRFVANDRQQEPSSIPSIWSMHVRERPKAKR